MKKNKTHSLLKTAEIWEKLILWSRDHFSKLPWRQNRNFYSTLVSEIMLQQTTVATVENRFKEFIVKFPSLKVLASSSEASVLQAWQGLGYYRRAKSLQTLSKELSHLDEKNLNQLNLEELQKFKGIGPYTAKALLALNQNKMTLAIDANIERVLWRVIGSTNLKILKKNNISKLELYEKLTHFFEISIVPNIKQFNYFNESLMDLGRVYCKVKKHCTQCPLNEVCVSSQCDNNADDWLNWKMESKATGQQKKIDVKINRILMIKRKKVLLVRRSKGLWLEDQWELPSFVSGPIINHQYPMEKEVNLLKLDLALTFKSSITKYKITNILYYNVAPKILEKVISWNQQDHLWIDIKELKKKSVPMTSVTMKALQAIEVI